MNCPDNSHDDARAPWNEGRDEGPVMMKCPRCQGRCQVPDKIPAKITEQTTYKECPKCEGTGEVNAH